MKTSISIRTRSSTSILTTWRSTYGRLGSCLFLTAVHMVILMCTSSIHVEEFAKETKTDSGNLECCAKRLQKGPPIWRKENWWKSRTIISKRCTGQTESSVSCPWRNNDYDVWTFASWKWQWGNHATYQPYCQFGRSVHGKHDTKPHVTCAWDSQEGEANVPSSEVRLTVVKSRHILAGYIPMPRNVNLKTGIIREPAE